MMEENSIIILKDRDIISISGSDSASFLQTVITNDIDKLNESNSLYSALLTPQGKYLHDFFILKHEKNYLIDCESETAENLLSESSKKFGHSGCTIVSPSTTNI